MIGHLAYAVAADLRARKYPHPVVYGPERVARTGFELAVVFMRDRPAGDPITAPAGANGRNPEVPYNRQVSGVVTVYTRSTKPAATVLDHEDDCDRVCDAVITAMRRILMARKLPLQIIDSRLLRREELHADTGEGPDTSGLRSADAPGCAGRIRFRVGTVVRDVDYKNEGAGEGVVFDVATPDVTFDGEAP